MEKLFFAPLALILAIDPISVISSSSSSVINQTVASWDINERIKELGGGPFCINPRIDEWVNGRPRSQTPPGNETCDQWRAGHMASDRRRKAGVEACTCAE